MDEKNKKLQELCRQYLGQLQGIAQKFGLGGFVSNMINENKSEKCKATEEEVKLLSRAVDDERVARKDVPKMLGKSYRQCFDGNDFDGNDFDNIEKLKHVGIYSKVSAEMYAAMLKSKE